MVPKERPDRAYQPRGINVEDQESLRSGETAGKAYALLKSCLERGAGAAELYLKQCRVNRLEGGEAGVLSQSKGRECGTAIRLYAKDGGDAFHASSGLCQCDLDDAFSILDFRNRRQSSPLPSLPAICLDEHRVRGIYDAGLQSYTTEQKIDMLRRMRASALAFSNLVQVDSVSWEDVELEHRLMNSEGMDQWYAETLCVLSISMFARKKGTVIPAGALSFSRSVSAVRPEALGEEAAFRAVLPLGGRPVDSGRHTALIHGSVALHLVRAFADRSVASWSRGAPFSESSRAIPALGSAVTLIDDGLFPAGLASAPFDAEGMPRQRTVVVEGGVPCGRLHDLASALSSDASSTGNALRPSYGKPPALGPTNFFLEPGRRDPEDLMDEIDSGLYIYNCLAPLTGADERSDWISLPVSGALIRSGRLAKPLGGVAIKAPLTSLLKGIREAASDLQFLPGNGACGSPSILVEDVAIEEI